MKNHLLIEGKKYISSREASLLTGYASDYVGQLSRSGKIDAKLVGRTWYVNEESILSYKNLGLEEASKFRPSVIREPANPRFSKILGKSVLVLLLLLVCIGTGAYTFSFEYPEIGRIAEKAHTIASDFSRKALNQGLPFMHEVADGASYLSEDVALQTASIFSSISDSLTSATLSFKTAVRGFLGIQSTQVVLSPDGGLTVATTTTIVKNTVTNVVEKPTYVSTGVDQDYVDTNIVALKSEIEDLRSYESRQTEAIYNSLGKSITNINMGFSDLNSFTTGDLAEGSNLYFTDSRVLSTLAGSATTSFGGDIVANAFYGDGSNLTGISVGSSFSTSTTRGVFSATSSLTYDSVNGVFGISTSTFGLTTSDILEGSRLYYTTDRFDERLAATSTLPNLTTLSNLASVGTIASGVWNGTAIGDAYLTKSGDWTGTFDGIEGSAYLARANHTGTQLASTISDFSSTARGMISSSATGLDYTSGTGDFSLTSGYNIPLTASTTEWASKVGSQWTTNGSDIYYTTGNVGIGTTSPSSKLSVVGDIVAGNIFATSSGTVGIPSLALGASNTGFYSGTASKIDVAIGGSNTQTFWNDGSLYLNNNAAWLRVGATSPAVLTRSANNTLRLSSDGGTGSADLVVNGNIGIGTTSPSSKLSVAGDSYFGGNVTATGTITIGAGVLRDWGSGQIGIGGASGNSVYVAAAGLGLTNRLMFGTAFGSYDTSLMRSSSGQLEITNSTTGVWRDLIVRNLSMGTTSTSTTLTVQGEAGKNPFSVASSTGTQLLSVTQAGRLSLGTGTGLQTLSGTASGLAVADYQGNSGSYVAQSFKESHAFSALTYYGLGFGGTSASNQIIGWTGTGTYSAGDARDTGLFRNAAGVVEINSGTAGTWRDLIVRNLSMGTTSTSTTLTVQGEAGKNPFSIASSTGTNLLSVTQAGSVGIGTTTPGAFLHVLGTTEQLRLGYSSSVHADFTTLSSGALVIRPGAGQGRVLIGQYAGDNGYATIALHSNTPSATNYNFRSAGGPGHLYINTPGASDYLYFQNGASTKMAMSPAGNFGIGSSTPSSKLTVGGDSFLGGNVTATGTLALTGLSLSTTGNFLCIDTTTNQITSGTTCTLSSSRFKENVQDLNLGLDTVLALRPVAFNFKQGYGDNGSTEQLGFVAEEADAIDPRLVPHDKDGLASGFNYANYTAVLTKAIQEQQVQIDALKNATSSTIVQQTIVATTSTTSIARELEESDSFIETIAQAIRDLIQSAEEFVVSKIRATLAVFDRVEVKTAVVSEGLEMKDQATGTIYCVMIKNGDWDKREGACADQVAHNQNQDDEDDSEPEEESDDNSATTTPDIIISTSTPEIIPETASTTHEQIITEEPLPEAEVITEDTIESETEPEIETESEQISEPEEVSVDNP